MTESDFAKIEKALAVRVPPDYRKHMSGVQVCEYGRYAPHNLFSHPDMVIERTVSHRQSAVLNYDPAGSRAMDKPWPAEFIIIGEAGDSDGNVLFVMAGEKASGVWKFSHETTGYAFHRLFAYLHLR